MPEEKMVDGTPLRADVVRDGDSITVRMAGEFDLASLDTARAALTEALGDGAARVVVDLGELSFIDSTGIAFLIQAERDDPDRRLRFLPSDSHAVRRVLRITGVERLFDGAGGG